MADEEQFNGHSGSLAERAAARRQQLLERTTTILDVPGYEGILQMEYRALSYAEIRRIGSRNGRISDDAAREQATSADMLIMASEQAYELDPETPDDFSKRKALGMGWGVPLARNLGVQVSETMTVRQAVMACFAHDTWLVQHYREWDTWASEAQIDVDEEQRLDFSRTTSPSSPTTP